MSNFNHIPFGLHAPSSTLVDVGDVSKGSRCDCICPSCKTPLIARQGEIKVWHFAHQSRSREQETEAPCEYSLEVSLRLMMKQLFDEGADFYLPEYRKLFSVPIPGCSSSYDKSIVVSKAAKVQFDSVVIEQKSNGVLFDLMLSKGEHNLYVYVTYHSRPFPYHVTQSDQGEAIVEFNVLALLNAFSKAKAGQYKKILTDFLASSTEGKQWRCHPREAVCLQQLRDFVRDNKDALKERYNAKLSMVADHKPVIKRKIQTVSPKLNETSKTEDVPVYLKPIGNKTEDAKQALNGAQNGCRVLLGSFDASFTEEVCKQETVIGSVGSFSPQFLHKCISCGSEWKGPSNHCTSCLTHKTTRSVFEH